MNRTDLTSALAERTGLSDAAARRVIDVLFGVTDGIIGSALRTDGAVSFGAFGKMMIRNRGPRTGRNPQTGEAIRVEASVSAVFRAGAALKQRLEHGPDDEPDGFSFRAPSSGFREPTRPRELIGREPVGPREPIGRELEDPARSFGVHGSGRGGRKHKEEPTVELERDETERP